MASSENTPAIIAVLKLLPSDPSKMEVLAALLNGETILRIEDGSLSTLDLVNLMKALEHNSTINHLTLSDIPIDLEISHALANLLDKNLSLQTLLLIRNSLNPETTQILADALERNFTLIEFGLMFNLETLSEIQILAKALEKNSHLTALLLSCNKIGPEGASVLAAMLEKNSTLECLDLRYSPLKKKGSEILAQALNNNRSLTTLNLNSSIDALDARSRRRNRTLSDGRVVRYSLYHESDNDTQHNGVSALLKRIEENSNLTSLDLSGNHLFVGSFWSLKSQRILVKGLISALEKNLKLKTLILNDTDLSSLAIAAIEKGLKVNSTLTSLSLDNNRLLHIYGLSNILKQNSALTHLSLKGCSLDLASIKILAKAIEHNTTLRNLDLQDNPFGEEGVKILMKALNKKNTHINISLSHHPHYLSQTMVNEFHNQVGIRRAAWQAAENRVTKAALNENRVMLPDLVDIVASYVAEDHRINSTDPEFEALVQKFMSGHKNEKPKEKKGLLSSIVFYLHKIWDGIVKLWHKFVNAILGKDKGAAKDSSIAEKVAQNKNQPLAIASVSQPSNPSASAHLVSRSESVTTNPLKSPKPPKTKR